MLHFYSDSVINMDVLKNTLVQLGYERVGQVEMPGQFSVRGGIVDIYSLTEENPWRIELWEMKWILSEALTQRVQRYS